MKTKRIIITISIILIATGALAFTWWKSQNTSTNTPSAPKITVKDSYISTEPTTQDQQEGGQTIKEGTTGSQSSSAEYDGNITAAYQSGEVLYVRTAIQTVTSQGTCALRMTGPSNKAYSESSSVQPLASYTTCKGFNVPISSLSAGDWSITIIYSDGIHKVTMKKDVKIQ